MPSPRAPFAGQDVPDDRRVLGSTSRRALFAEGVLASASDSVIPFLPVYLVALGASATQVGLLASATAFAGLVVLFPAAWMARRVRSRKRVVLLGGWGFARIALLPIAAIPFFADAELAVIALIALGGVRVLTGALSHPSWMSLFADVVPARLTGLYNARRSLAASLTGLAIVPAVGWFIGRNEGVEGYQWAFLGAAGIGALGAYSVSRVREPACATERPRRTAYRAALRDARFRRYLLAMMVLHGFATLSGPFVIVHMVQQLGASTTEVGLMVTGESIAAVAGQLAMSALVVRISSRRLFVLSIVGIALAPVAWVLIAAPWQAFLPVLLGGTAWAICHLAVFNLLMEYAPREDLPDYVAAQQLAMLGVGFLAPLAGSILVAQIGIVPLFLLSAAGRLLAVPIFTAPIPSLSRAPLARLRARATAVDALE